MKSRSTLCALLLAALWACDTGPRNSTGAAERLGPLDGHDLPATDLDRVVVGEEAPDFSLASLAGPVVTLSEFRGSADVVLVFYRGHW